MRKEIVRTEEAPSSPLYSQGVRVGSTIYVSGMAGIDVATKQFAKHGFDAATTASIAKAAGVTEPILYRHFDSKRALYRSRCCSRIRQTSRG